MIGGLRGYVWRGWRIHIGGARTVCWRSRGHPTGALGTLTEAQVREVSWVVATIDGQWRERRCLRSKRSIVPHGRVTVVRSHCNLSRGHTTVCLDGKHILGRQTVVHDDVLQHVYVQRNVKGTRSHRRHLPKHHVFCDTMTIVLFPHSGSFHENFDGLLKGASHERPGVCAIDTVSSNGHESTPVGH